MGNLSRRSLWGGVKGGGGGKAKGVQEGRGLTEKRVGFKIRKGCLARNVICLG